MATIIIPQQTVISAARKHNDTLSLFTLPQEIRDEIYGFLFEGQYYPLHLKVDPNEATFRQHQTTIRHVLHACQRFAAEARQVFHSKVVALGLDRNPHPVPLLEQIHRSPFDITQVRRIHHLTEDYDADVGGLVDLLPHAKKLERLDISSMNRAGDYKVLVPKEKFEAFTNGGRQALRRMFGGRIGMIRMELEDTTIDKILGVLRDLQHKKPLVVVRLVAEIVGRNCKATADGGVSASFLLPLHYTNQPGHLPRSHHATGDMACSVLHSSYRISTLR